MSRRGGGSWRRNAHRVAGPAPMDSPSCHDDTVGESASGSPTGPRRVDQPVDGHAWHHDLNPRGVDLSPALDAARTHRVQLTVSNKDVWQRSQQELQSSQDRSKKLRELKRLHPNFYPRPIDLEESVPGAEPADRTEGFLSEDNLIEPRGVALGLGSPGDEQQPSAQGR